MSDVTAESGVAAGSGITAGNSAAAGDEIATAGGVTAGSKAAGRRRPGRRPGSADTRGEIMAAARRTFAEKGFDKATIRGIAREAGVDPALVHHYFASKEGLFVAAMELPVNPEDVIPLLVAGPREETGERLVRFILTITSDARARQPVLALMRTAMTNEQVVGMIREFMTHALLEKVGEALGVPPIRMEAAFAQLFGVVLVRYVIKLEPIASVGVEELVALLAPTIQRYIDGS
ncbi:TetR family transcriptional regulator [Planobispora rosea]|uniref:TetR family transcriptional regulator n=1 Tax=Planobispora rosea TaxID=35762 RepID=A0A8J3W9M5_PLARO|nr:TetR family transcriptional regulator [Planobispora rosea]GGS75681.1 TetR family transcriptional regulator [Planobispora rosea]GIH81889.1 TetR family transcriptional regulator [Planobispora rosea]